MHVHVYAYVRGSVICECSGRVTQRYLDRLEC